MNDNPNEESASAHGSENGAPDEDTIAGAINSLKRSYETASNESGENERQHIIWARRTTKAAIAYTVLTFLLLLASGYSVYETIQAVSEAGRGADAALAGQRAWVAPMNATLESALDPNSTVAVVIVSALNVGHEPALGIVSSAKVDAAPVNPGPPDDHACAGQHPDLGNSIIYPSDHFGVTLRFPRDFSNVPGRIDQILKGTYLL